MMNGTRVLRGLRDLLLGRSELDGSVISQAGRWLIARMVVRNGIVTAASKHTTAGQTHLRGAERAACAGTARSPWWRSQHINPETHLPTQILHMTWQACGVAAM